jgi:hypothetical protein
MSHYEALEVPKMLLAWANTGKCGNGSSMKKELNGQKNAEKSNVLGRSISDAWKKNDNAERKKVYAAEKRNSVAEKKKIDAATRKKIAAEMMKVIVDKKIVGI